MVRVGGGEGRGEGEGRGWKGEGRGRQRALMMACYCSIRQMLASVLRLFNVTLGGGTQHSKNFQKDFPFWTSLTYSSGSVY